MTSTPIIASCESRHVETNGAQVIVFHRRGVEFLPPRQLAVQLAKSVETILVDGAVPWKAWKSLPLRTRTTNESKSLRRYVPFYLPERYGLSRWTRRHNLEKMRRELLRLTRDATSRFVVFDSPYQLDLVGSFDECRSAYYVYDDYKVDIVGVPNDTRLAKLEPEMLARVDVVFAVSRLLADECSRYNDNVVYLPNGFNPDVFSPKFPPDPTEEGKSRKKGPTIGFAGVISGRVDFEGLYATALERPDWNFVFLGTLSKDISNELARTGRQPDIASRFFDLPAVNHLGEVPLADVPGVVGTFDVALIPYCLSRFTKASSPLKAYEYYAMGKPTVSTRVPEVVGFDREMIFADEGQSYVVAIEKALKLVGNAAEMQRRTDLAANHSMKNRADVVLNAILS